jgi:hypothetical protein
MPSPFDELLASEVFGGMTNVTFCHVLAALTVYVVKYCEISPAVSMHKVNVPDLLDLTQKLKVSETAWEVPHMKSEMLYPSIITPASKYDVVPPDIAAVAEYLIEFLRPMPEGASTTC